MCDLCDYCTNPDAGTARLRRLIVDIYTLAASPERLEPDRLTQIRTACVLEMQTWPTDELEDTDVRT